LEKRADSFGRSGAKKTVSFGVYSRLRKVRRKKKAGFVSVFQKASLLLSFS